MVWCQCRYGRYFVNTGIVGIRYLTEARLGVRMCHCQSFDDWRLTVLVLVISTKWGTIPDPPNHWQIILCGGLQKFSYKYTFRPPVRVQIQDVLTRSKRWLIRLEFEKKFGRFFSHWTSQDLILQTCFLISEERDCTCQLSNSPCTTDPFV
jgi:hypothetical protein